MRFADVHLSGEERTVRFPLHFGPADDDDYHKLPIPSSVESIFIIADATVDSHHGETLETLLGRRRPIHCIRVASGEASKSLESLSFLLERLVGAGANRRSFLLSFGGGMIGNLTGLAASLLFRGVRFAHLPTTLLAGSDSVISLKQAVNSRWAKNTFGCYSAPDFVVFDFRWLATLPPAEFRSGLCESIKNALAIRPESIPRLRTCLGSAATDSESLEWIVGDSIAAKLSVIANDPAEQRNGLVLEYGHTVGHAVELADRQSRGALGLAHGEAVAVGMIAEALIANRLGFLSDVDLDTHRTLIAAAGAADEIPPDLDRNELMRRICKDNKRGYLRCDSDDVAMVLLQRLGKPVLCDGLPIVNVPRLLVREVLERIQKPTRVAVSAVDHQLPEISVIVLTTGMRPTLLDAIASVFSQDYRPLQLLLLIDGDEGIPPLGEPPEGCSVRIARVGRDRQVSGRVQTLSHVARLRNLALELVRTPLLAFLDDDNRWAPEHLSSLYAALVHEGADASHCWRRIFSAEGDRARLTGFPWLPEGLPLERKTFAACEAAGLLHEGDNTIRDAAVGIIGLQTGMVDMGSWLLRREILADFRFPEAFTSSELAEGLGEDDALLADLQRRGVSIACSKRATLDYRLGGFSNGGNALERRSRNIALSRLDIQEKRTILRAMPRFVLVELSRFCNLACSMCREPGMIDKSQTMSAETFSRIEAEILPFADIVDLRGWGESLLLPEFSDRLARTVKLGARTRVVTNLSFRRDAVLSQLAEVGTYIGVSLDAADAKILRTLRRGANSELISRNMAILGEIYAKRGIIDRIAIYLTVQRPAIDDLTNVVELAATCGIRDIRLAPVTGCDNMPISIAGSAPALRESLNGVRRRAKALGVVVSSTARLPGEDDLASMPSPCLHPWTHCYVAWDGRIGFCDHLIGPAGDEFILGTLSRTPFHDIWNGPDWSALRAEHLNGKHADAPHFAECAWCYRNRHLDSEDLLEPGLSAKRHILAADPGEVRV